MTTKLIGLLGGTSWPSTSLPYRMMNEDVQRRLGGEHSARIILYSIDYHEIKSRYWDRWAEIPALLKREVDQLLSFGPDCWMMANNTLHKAYDSIAGDIASNPFFHAVTDRWVVRSYAWTTINRPPQPPHLHWCGHVRDIVAKRDGEWKIAAKAIMERRGARPLLPRLGPLA